MNPEPSERLSERGPGPGPGTPGCWRGIKRRKNSWISSSSMPGICGSALVRRTACVVLMLTTALPCSSTRRVKRSEEHTSELQSLAYLVCRLLLEKKKPRDDTLLRVVDARRYPQRL